MQNQKKSQFGGKNGSGSFQQIISEVPAGVEFVVIGFLGSCPLFRYFNSREVRVIGFDTDPEVIYNYRRHGGVFLCDSIAWLDRHIHLLSRQTFVYLDPPYMMSARKCQQKRYHQELTDLDHELMLSIVRRADCSVAISHYEVPFYNSRLSGWRKKKWPVGTHAGRAVECLYMNYDTPERLFSYEFLGTDRTDRQRIQRKKKRWIEKLQGMDSHEANAIIEYINTRYRRV